MDYFIAAGVGLGVAVVVLFGFKWVIRAYNDSMLTAEEKVKKTNATWWNRVFGKD